MATPSGPTQKLQAAAASMRSVETFRFTADVTSGSQQAHVSGEFSAPDALHETVTIGSSTLEVIRIGGRTFRRDSAAAAWQVVAATKVATPTDPRSAFAVLAKATAVRMQAPSPAAGSTASTSTYLFTLAGTAAASLVNGSTGVTGGATLAGGRISEMTYQSARPAVSVHLTYAGVNATPAVTAPPGL